MDIGGMTVNHEPPGDESVKIGPLTAMGIAGTWHSPGGFGFVQFASTGTITDDLLDDIDQKIDQLIHRDPALGVYVSDDGRDGWVDGDLGSVESNLREMRELRAYVMACTVPVWTVGSNYAGYLPEGDVHAFLSYADAVMAHVDAVEAAPDDLADLTSGGDCSADGPCVDGGESCDYHSIYGQVGAYLMDEVPAVVNGKVFVDARELSIALRPDDKPLPTVYFLSKSTRVVADYVREREGF
jgi:hypothetical protein